MKKIFKFALMVSLLVASTSAFAQNTGKPEYPRYGFWSNWSIGASIDYNHELLVNNNATSWGMDVFAQQKLNHVFDYRFRLGMPTLFSTQPDFDAANDNYRRENHWTFSLDIMISLNNAILGYDPDRRFSIYLFGGPGVKFNDKWGLISNLDSANAARANTQRDGAGRGLVMLTLGQGISYRLGDNHHLFCEYSFDATDIVNIFNDDFYKWHDVNSIVRFGYYYCFGVTAADQAVAAQKAMLSQENFGALNTQVSNLESQVAASRNNEKKLENRIAELEDQLAEARANQGASNNGVDSEAAKQLQATIDQIKAEQLNFYAMPFSVQYDVNEWKVSDEEMDKVKAVARVLKDNPDVKIMVVGFADYTGSDQYNMKLSERRANEVKRLLTKTYGIAEDRISTDYKGKSVAFGDIQYALNRRVSFYRVID